jgi:hypothetical protein
MLPLSFIYNSLRSSNKKERFDIILEPLQAILQLSLLSSTPIDTKITIYNNILYIQTPTWKQSISRTYYNDSKSDLFYLFSVITRFNKFYEYLNYIKNNETNLFNLLKEMSIKGIDNLLQTYKQTDNPALLHTLQIYKNLLNTPVKTTEIEINNINNDEISRNNSVSSFRSADISSNVNNLINFNTAENYDNFYSSNTPILNQPLFDPAINSINPINANIDNVFINIRNLYSTNELSIIFNTLLLIQKYPNNYLDYINGLNIILEPINKKIKKWIVDNIVY